MWLAQIHTKSCIWSSNAYEGFHTHPQLTSKSQAPIWYEGSPGPDHWLATPMCPFVFQYTRIYVLIQASCVYGTSYRALFNEERDCPEGPHLSNGVRGERPALDRGTIQGGKPADNVPTFVADTCRGLPLQPMLTKGTCV